jgi:hypothetical protein
LAALDLWPEQFCVRNFFIPELLSLITSDTAGSGAYFYFYAILKPDYLLLVA